MANSKISALTSASTPLAGTETLPVVQSGATKKVSVADLTAGRAIDVSGITATGNSYFATTSGNAGVGSTTIYNAAGFAKVISIYGSTSAATSYATSSYQYQVGATSDRWGVYDGTAGAWRIYMLSSGNIGLGDTSPTEQLSIGTGNIKFGTAAKGINFTANTPAAGKTSTLLNWYEEGTFTPTYTSTGTPPTVTYSHQYGKYTRIGRQVFFTVEIGTNSAAAGTGLLAVGGLPFTAVNDRFTGTFSIGYADGFTIAAPSGGYVFANETIARLTYEASATSKTEMLTTFLTNGSGKNYLVISGMYIV